MDRVEFRQRVEKILRTSRMRDWSTAFEDVVTQIMNAHDETVEAALEEYEQALNESEVGSHERLDRLRSRSSLECPEDVQLEEVTNEK
jgi:hypothetical protein